jgi:hypothetical protein
MHTHCVRHFRRENSGSAGKCSLGAKMLGDRPGQSLKCSLEPGRQSAGIQS